MRTRTHGNDKPADRHDPATWSGIFPAVLTMFDTNGDVDRPAYRRHLEYLLAEGVHGLVVAGTSGEFALLDDEERIALIEIAVETAAGRVPVIAGTGHPSTRMTIQSTLHAAEVGADGAIVILPYYVRPTLSEVIEHFREVGLASPIPVMAYNNPANSAAPALGPSDLQDLYREGAIRAVKSTFPTVHEVHESRSMSDEGFRVFYGSFMAPLEAMAGGAHGWISGILNVAARDAVDLWESIRRGDIAAARHAWARILPLKLLYTNQLVGPIGDLAIYRAILRLRARDGGHSRKPIADLDGARVERLQAILERDGLMQPT